MIGLKQLFVNLEHRAQSPEHGVESAPVSHSPPPQQLDPDEFPTMEMMTDEDEETDSTFLKLKKKGNTILQNNLCFGFSKICSAAIPRNCLRRRPWCGSIPSTLTIESLAPF